MKTGIDASKLVSMLLELVTAVCMVTGITLTAQMGGGFMGGGTAFCISPCSPTSGSARRAPSFLY